VDSAGTGSDHRGDDFLVAMGTRSLASLIDEDAARIEDLVRGLLDSCADSAVVEVASFNSVI